MKNFDSRTYSVNDFLEWDERGQLELSPKFQRRAVWSEVARSYLMDTIVRGKPIPKIFIRQRLNPMTRESVREVVDGQQRLRTILSYLKDGFQISKRHHASYGGLYYSQLSQIDPEVQANILNYELAVDLLVNLPDKEVLDVFARLNSYALVLNEQEKLNAKYFGPFKRLAERLGHDYNTFWNQNRILTPQQILRMGDVTLVSDIVIAMVDGIKSKKQIKNYFALFERSFPYDEDLLEARFREIVEMIRGVLRDNLRNTEFRRIHLFYTIFTAFYHLKFGLKGLKINRVPLHEKDYPKLAAKLERVDDIFAADDIRSLTKDEAQFLQDCRRATTDGPVRTRRTEFVLKLIVV